MSFVYLAHDVSTNERYAIKILSPALSKDENSMARLRREASLGIRLVHPNVCNIVRLGETEDAEGSHSENVHRNAPQAGHVNANQESGL